MDYQECKQLVDSIGIDASIYSFDELADGSYGELRLVAFNDYFGEIVSLNPTAPKFEPGTPYNLYFEDANFEKYCYRCALSKQPLHFFANAHDMWLHGFYFPLKSDKEGVYYCGYVLSRSEEPDTDLISSRDPGIAAAVLETSIKLHKTTDFVEAMKAACADVAKICGTKRCIFMVVDKTAMSCSVITEKGRQESYGKGIAASMGRTLYEMALSWEADLAGSDCLILENEEDMQILERRDPAWYRSLKAYSVKSLVIYALRFNKKLVGFMWTANFNTHDTVRIKEILGLNSFFIASTIATHQLLKNLEYLGKIDSLTGANNRNALDNTIALLESGKHDDSKGLGVVYVDLNGLKRVNDRYGHAAGDKLLKKTAALLKTVFYDRDVYRVGGDEFLAICTDTTESDLDTDCDELRRLVESTNDVSLAIGCAYNDTPTAIRALMRAADTRMYEDKRAFYERNPHLLDSHRK